jgi:outer membrane protein assembly factor BamD (BamD/ComL family)
MKRTAFYLFATILVITAGCKPSREDRISDIQNLEQELFAPEVDGFSQQKADSLLSLYTEFIREHPKDSLSPGYLFKAANITMNSENGAEALTLFDQYLNDYPDQPKAPMCLFFKAFIYENLIRNLDKARETYLLFIEKYPSDDFTNDAKLALMNLGKSPDMIVREFEAKLRADSLRMADSLAKVTRQKPR